MNKQIRILSTLTGLLSVIISLAACSKSAPPQLRPAAVSEQRAGSVPGILRLAEKLRHSRAGTTHILVLGDSHTSADFFTGQLRTQLQSRYGNGGPGFISPLAVPGNRYSQLQFSHIRGWKLDSSRRAHNSAFTLGGNIATATAAHNQLQISASDGEMQLRAQALYRAASRAILTMAGRPLSLQATGARWQLSPVVTVPASFTLSLTSGQAQLAGWWLTAAQPHGVIVSALGTNGAQLSLMEKWQADWPGVMTMLRPDLVILAYGTNEVFDRDLPLASYRQQLTQQIGHIRAALPQAAILLIGPGSSIMHKTGATCAQRQPPLLKPLIAIQQQVAREQGALFWNWFSFMGGDCAIEKWATEERARPDLVHLTAKGYEDSAQGLWQFLAQQLAHSVK